MTQQLFRTHMDVIETSLLAQSQIAANAGHPNHIGFAREAFIKEFLIQHLPHQAGVGSGAIITSTSMVGESRNQIDIIIYDRTLPKLEFGGAGTTSYFAESVMAAIEVKSTLKTKHLEDGFEVAAKLIAINRQVAPNEVNPVQIPYYLVAYKSELTLETVRDWLQKRHAESNTNIPIISGVFILGLGNIINSHTPVFYILPKDIRDRTGPNKWLVSICTSGNLYSFFFMLTYPIYKSNLEHYYEIGKNADLL